MGFSIFNTYKPRKFDYKPLYYNEEKEKAEQRKRQLNEEYVPGDIIKSGMSKNRGRIEERRKSYKSKRMRFVVMIVLAAALIYFMFIR